MRTPYRVRRPLLREQRNLWLLPWRIHAALTAAGLRLDAGMTYVDGPCRVYLVAEQALPFSPTKVAGQVQHNGHHCTLFLSRADRWWSDSGTPHVSRSYAPWTSGHVVTAVKQAIRLAALGDLADTGDDTACAAYWQVFNAEHPEHNPKPEEVTP